MLIIYNTTKSAILHPFTDLPLLLHPVEAMFNLLSAIVLIPNIMEPYTHAHPRASTLYNGLYRGLNIVHVVYTVMAITYCSSLESSRVYYGIALYNRY